MKTQKMSEFKFKCPKCKSNNFEVTRENTGYGRQDGWLNRVFACRCGKRLYGVAIRDEYDLQVESYETQGRKLKAAARRIRAQAREREALLLLQSVKAEPVKVPVPVKVKLVPPPPEPEPIPRDCVWDGCSSPARPNSKYCSRDCSNKNARWQHKQRKKMGE